jgi:integrase
MPLIKRPRVSVLAGPHWPQDSRLDGHDRSRCRREFERVLIERTWRLEKLGDRGAIPFDEAAQRWLTSSARPKGRDRELIDWLAPRIGNEAVRDVAESDALEEIRNDGAAAGWSHSTIDRLMGTVSAVLRDCVKRGELERAPAIPMYRPQKGEPRWLTPEEFEQLAGELSMHQVLAARFAVHSLLRMRAMGKIEWKRISFEQRRAWIPGAHQKAGRTFSFPLTDELIRILRALRWLSPPASPYVFTWNGKRIDDFNTRSFQEAVKRAAVAPLRWHDLRHTGASWAVQAGVTLPELMMLGDWKDYRSVLVYAHLAPSHAAAAADRVAQWSHTQRTVPKHQRARKHR